MRPHLKPRVKVPRPLERTAGVDWFRYVIEDGEVMRQALEIADEIHEEDRRNGSTYYPWDFQQYHGYASDSLRWGRSGGKMLWETSGQRARSTWVRMPATGGRATRVDLQTTLLLSTAQPDLPLRFLPPEAMNPPYLLPDGTPVREEQGARGLSCVRVAQRRRREHWRFYDKGTEQDSHAPGLLWRLELELKKSDAKGVVCQYREELQNPVWVRNFCVQRWLSRGCSWPFTRDAEAAAPFVREPEPVPSAERLLEWLKTSVAPTIPRLLMAYSHEEVARALGLSPPAPRKVGRDSDTRPTPTLWT